MLLSYKIPWNFRSRIGLFFLYCAPQHGQLFKYFVVLLSSPFWKIFCGHQWKQWHYNMHVQCSSFIVYKSAMMYMLLWRVLYSYQSWRPQLFAMWIHANLACRQISYYKNIHRRHWRRVGGNVCIERNGQEFVVHELAPGRAEQLG